MQGSTIDITGQKFHSLTAIKFVRRENRRTYWLFRCDCGNEKEIQAKYVKGGNAKTCGCRKGLFIDITGQKFNKLTAIKRVKTLKSQGGQWLFKCDCGKEKEICGYHVKRGLTKSCGCISRVDITGQKFGRLTALQISSTEKKIRYLFRCDCGMEKELDKSSVVSGNTISCGCYNREKTSLLMAVDITGKRAGLAVAVKQLRRSKNGLNWLWECLCDCGNVFESFVRPFTHNKFLSCGCQSPILKGDKNPNWKGGKNWTAAGYILVKASNHPFANKAGYMFEHRVVMEQKIGRYLFSNENVHHRNGKRDDNRIENLELWVTWQPSGQRPEDLVEYSLEILRRYAPEKIAISF